MFFFVIQFLALKERPKWALTVDGRRKEREYEEERWMDAASSLNIWWWQRRRTTPDCLLH